MKRTVIALVAALLVVTGCTGSDEPAEPEPTSAGPTAEPTESPSPTPTVVAPADLVIEPGRVGPAVVGMSKADAAQTGLFDVDLPAPADGCPPYPLQWKKPYKGLDVLTGNTESITTIGISEGGPKTAKGIGVGSTLEDVTAAYPNLSPVVDAGFNQAGAFEYNDKDEFIGFLFGDATPTTIKKSTKISFIEVTTGTKPDLIRSGC